MTDPMADFFISRSAPAEPDKVIVEDNAAFTFPQGTFIGNNIPSDIPECATIFVQGDTEPSWWDRFINFMKKPWIHGPLKQNGPLSTEKNCELCWLPELKDGDICSNNNCPYK